MNAMRRWLSVAVFAIVFFSAFGASARAAEGAESNPAEETIGTVFKWLNFAIIFGGLGYIIARKGPAFFRARAEVISSAMTHAAAAKAEADRQLREAEEKLGRLDQEIAELRAASQREAAAEAERLRAATRAEIEKIHRAAKAEIEAAERAARTELKALAARAAVERAGALLRQRITADTHAQLFRSFLDGLAGGVN